MAKKIPPPDPALAARNDRRGRIERRRGVKKLLADGFPIDTPLAERHKETVLGEALRTGGKAVDVMFALIDAGADLRKGGVTLLTAVQLKSEPLARRLIESGFDPNVKNRFRESALQIAARDPSILEIVRMLIAAGASVKGEEIHSAAAAGNLQAARMILDAGAKVPARSASPRRRHLPSRCRDGPAAHLRRRRFERTIPPRRMAAQIRWQVARRKPGHGGHVRSGIRPAFLPRDPAHHRSRHRTGRRRRRADRSRRRSVPHR